jgi:hypothetical protein
METVQNFEDAMDKYYVVDISSNTAGKQISK